MNIDFHPKHARQFIDMGTTVVDALNSYDRAIKTDEFPSAEESFR